MTHGGGAGAEHTSGPSGASDGVARHRTVVGRDCWAAEIERMVDTVVAAIGDGAGP